MTTRRDFLRWSAVGALASTWPAPRLLAAPATLPPVVVEPPRPGEDLFAYVRRRAGEFDGRLYRQVLGAANAFKEGDAIVGVAAEDDASRAHARTLHARTRVRDIDSHPLLDDELSRLLANELDREARRRTSDATLGELCELVVRGPVDEVHAALPGLSSEVVACVVKLLSDEQLTDVGARLFHPLPGSQIGAPGRLGARIQPNSPTDHVDDIRWQVLDGWAYAVGDVLLGTNPVSSDPRSVHAVEETLRDLLEAFGLFETLPHCVLAHIDVQAEVERSWPGSTALWFQSIAGSQAANATFDISVDKMVEHARRRTGRFGLYFETGQGADFTNGHAQGCDMVLHESRKYGFARALTRVVAEAQRAAGAPMRPWVHVNDVAGFIGPEVFRTKEQLVRCCLEDIVMGKLHGLCIGLDVCSTLHMDVSLDDLDWCLERIVPACPAYLMALPTKIDPMLGYLTTGYQDHVRLRERFDLRVDERMQRFFRELGVVDDAGRPTRRFGDPLWVYLQYRRRKGDLRDDATILAEGRRQLDEVRGRGVFVASGHGATPSDLEPELERQVRDVYADAKQCIWAELPDAFAATIPGAVELATLSADREDYILHPESGERLAPTGQQRIERLRQEHQGRYDVQLVVSDGLDALAISDPDQLAPFLERARRRLAEQGWRAAPETLVVRAGRVRAGYRIGETLFGGLDGRRAVLHVIGERPGSGHRTYSIYITCVAGSDWGTAGKIDHNLTRVVSGVAATALLPTRAADETARILETLRG